jgi:hypothetical protein
MGIISEPTGVVLVDRWGLSAAHRKESETCPGCGANLLRVGLPELAYAFRVCGCGEVGYEHLVEQLWHLACLQGRHPDVDSAASAVLSALAHPRHHGITDATVRLGMALKARSA